MVENVKDDASLKNEINISCNVIVVEDNEGLSRLIEISLKEAGLNVALANNGKQAIDWLLTIRLILCCWITSCRICQQDRLLKALESVSLKFRSS